MVRLVKACLVTACLGLAVPVSFVWLSYGVLRFCKAVMLRSGPLIWVMASCGQAVKFRQGPSGSVELRRVGARRFCCGKVRLVSLGLGLAVELG